MINIKRKEIWINSADTKHSQIDSDMALGMLCQNDMAFGRNIVRTPSKQLTVRKSIF